MKKNQFVEIMGHHIKYKVTVKNVHLTETEIEHIQYMIAQGITSGDLNISYGKNNSKETSGWWEIINWKSIALECYNKLGSEANSDSARKLFNDNWN